MYCIIDLFLSTRVYFIFAVQKLAKISSNCGNVHFEGLVNLLRYIRDNTTLGLNYYDDTRNTTLSDLLRQANINTENQFMAFYDYSWQDCTGTGISTGTYFIFYQGRPIDHGTHVPGPVAQLSAESEYNTEYTAGISLASFRVLIILPEEAPIMVLGSKSDVCMANNGKDTKHTRHIYRISHYWYMERNAKCTRLTDVREVCKWETLQLRMLGRMI